MQLSDSQIVEAQRTFSLAYSTWNLISNSLYSSHSIQLSLLSLEKWLIEFDPLFSLSDSLSTPAISPQQYLRVKSSHSLQYQLHSRHSLLMTVCDVFARLTLSEKSAIWMMRSYERGMRSYEILRAINEEMTMERGETEKELSVRIKIEYLDKASSTISKKNIQGWRKTCQDFAQNVEEFRRVMSLPDEE